MGKKEREKRHKRGAEEEYPEASMPTASSGLLIKWENIQRLSALIMGWCQILIIYSNYRSGFAGADVPQAGPATE